MKEFLTISETAVYLNLAEPTIYKLSHLNILPKYKPFGQRLTYFKRSEIDEWIINGRIPSAEELQSQANLDAFKNKRNNCN
jgi:excisionase family DNA binding protein